MGIESLVSNLQNATKEQADSRIVLFEKNVVSNKYPFEKMPRAWKNVMEVLASIVLDPEGKSVIVRGGPKSGKSFAIEQLFYNIDRFLPKSTIGNIVFIRMSEVTFNTFQSLPAFQKVFEKYMKDNGLTERNLCFVTESFSVAIGVKNIFPDTIVIYEVNNDTIEGLVDKFAENSSREWHKWKFLDINNALLSKRELNRMMKETIVEKMNNEYKKNLSTKDINTITTTLIKELDCIALDDYGEFVTLPTGVVSTFIKDLYSDMNYISHKDYHMKNKPRLNKFIDKVLGSLGDLFDYYDLERNFDLTPESSGIVFKKNGYNFSNMNVLLGELKKNVVGQDEAIEKIVDSFIIPAANLQDDTKPVRSLLFLGPTGVGKTETALQLSKNLYDTPVNLVRIDMSEYQESHTVSKLFGSPPGYVGFEEGGRLTNAVKKDPNSIILLDEVEKAHPQVWDSFLQILDAGVMTDSHKGEEIDFTNSTIIMTSNIGAREASRPKVNFTMGNNDGEEELKKQDNELIMKKELENIFRLEFINRLDDIIVFNNISNEAAGNIVNLNINRLIEKAKMKININVLLGNKKEIVEFIVSKADITKYGAREINRVIDKQVYKPMALHVISNNDLKDDSNISMLFKDGAIVFENDITS